MSIASIFGLKDGTGGSASNEASKIEYDESDFVDIGWERVAGHTYRLAVPGGYLYRHGNQGYCWTPVMVFVPSVANG